jgi:hypothetical protein
VKTNAEGVPLLWSVDRSWSRYRGNSNGDLAPSAQTKLHIDRGDSSAKCSRRIFLNSLTDDVPVGFSGGGMSMDTDSGTASENVRDDVCRRCVPDL